MPSCVGLADIRVFSSCAKMMGAPSFAAFSVNIFLVSGVASPIITGVQGFMMPAFSAAIAVVVLPRNWVWSRLMLVMMILMI